MTLPKFPHRMSSAELEARLYIENDPYHSALLMRNDYDLVHGPESEPKVLKKNQQEGWKGYFIQQENSLTDLRETVRSLSSNEEKLKTEIIQLNLELGYIAVPEEVKLPALVKV